MSKLLFILTTGTVTLLALWALSAYVSRLFVKRSIAHLLRSIGKESLPNFSSQLSEILPEPVQRYLNFALKEGQKNIRYAILTQQASFRHRPDSRWFTVRATEYISGMEPGFVWDAVLRHNATWWRTAKLSYMHGLGYGHIKLFGALTLQEHEGRETDISMLFRYLSELVWLPTGLIPTKTLRWEPIDDNSALAIISDGGIRVEATFHVNQAGEIDSIKTAHKFRDHKSGFEQQPFTLECRAYRDVEGVMIPTRVDFIWNLESGDFRYGQFEIVDVRYFYN
jgi:hypothetical protein